MAEQQPQQMNEEQIKALQEKLKQMSPEELKEFQKKQCIFCQIISGNVQSRKIYEDEHVLAVLDINPSNPGHVLVMPREHYSIMPQIPEEEIEHLFLTTKMLANASLRALEVQGSNILVANGVAAGQRAQHFMVHLVPRKENDNLQFEVPQKNIPEEELDEISRKLSESLGAATGEKQAPMPSFPQQKEVVEAEFMEKPAEVPAKDTAKRKPSKKTKPKIPERKKSAKSKKSEKQSKPKEQEKKQSQADLDDIARILGAK